VDVVVLAMAFAKARDAIGWIEHVLSREVPMTLVTIPLFTGSVIVWTAVGLIAGLAFHLSTSDDPDWVLGSSNIAFTAVVALLAAAGVAAVLVVQRRWWRGALIHAVTILAAFGWLLPALGR
jgi:hypothetical protein